ncbi:MAG: Fe-S cluster assembly protein SufB [Patescibacteria group bacterium]
MTIPKRTKKTLEKISNQYKFGFKTDTNPIYKSPQGLNNKIVEEISRQKAEPEWMLNLRKKALEIFFKKPLPSWGGDLTKINFDLLHYYIKPQDKIETQWKNVPKEIKKTFDKLGVPQAERKFLAGTGAQFESEMIYHSLQKELTKKGVIFESTDIALKKYPKLFKEYFGKVVPVTDNKFAALNYAVWSGGSFIYVPKNTHVNLPLQAYFRINAERMGQFERTLIIADEGSSVHYIEGCTAPIYSTDSLHSAVVEIIVKKGARVQYTTIQNWSNNVYNLVTKRAFVYENAEMLWLDCNIGSRLTMKYPAIFLLGENAKGEIQSLAFAKENQHQDTGAKIFHSSPNTSSKIVAKSISKSSGRNSYRGLLKISKGAKNTVSHVSCNALLIDENSRSDTYPTMKVEEESATVAHEATVSKISEEQMFYLMSRGLSEEEAVSTIVNGFATPIIKQLPMEYALELNRLIELEMTTHVA